MKKALPAPSKTLLALACAATVFAVQPAAAQLATDVICTGCVDSTDIADGTVKTQDLANKSVNGAKIQNNSVTSSDVANDSLTGRDILNGSLKSGDIANSSLTGIDVADGTLTGADIADNSLTGADVQNGSLTGADIQNNSLNGADIQFNSVPARDLSNEAGADSAGGNQTVDLSLTETVVRSVTLSAPSSGRVIVNASGYFFYSPSGAARCSITTGVTLDFTALIASRSSSDLEFDSWGATRAFNQVAGATTYNLVCDEFSGTASVSDTQLNAIFVPTVY